jgi:hypothetical protein
LALAECGGNGQGYIGFARARIAGEHGQGAGGEAILPEPFGGAVVDVREVDEVGLVGGGWFEGCGWMDGGSGAVSDGTGYGVVGRGWEGRPQKVASPRRRLWKGIQGLRGGDGESRVLGEC